MGLKDFRLYCVCFLIAAIGILAIFRSSWFGRSESADSSVSWVVEVLRESGHVRKKDSGSLVWHDLVEAKSSAQMGDTVYTGEDGKARIIFPGGMEAVVNSNSMVVIQKSMTSNETPFWTKWKQVVKGSPGSVPMLNIKKGGVEIHTADASSLVIVSVESHIYRLDSLGGKGNVVLNLREKNEGAKGEQKLEVTTQDDAHATLTEVGGVSPSSIELSKRRTEEIAVPHANPEPENVVDPPSLAVPSIQVSTRVLSKNQLYSIPVQIRWNPIQRDQLAEDHPYEVEVFHKDAKLMDETSLKNSFFEFKIKSLDQDPYSFRVTATLRSGEKIQSEKTPIEIQTVAPTLKTAKASALVGEKTLISWSRTALTSGYRVQVAEDPQFEKTFYDKELSENFLLYPTAKKGVHYVRVQSLLSGITSAWSAVREIRVQ